MDGWLDKAMGLELEANEIESELEWAEAQGRDEDAVVLQHRLESVFGQLAAVVEDVPAAHIDARRAA